MRLWCCTNLILRVCRQGLWFRDFSKMAERPKLRCLFADLSECGIEGSRDHIVTLLSCQRDLSWFKLPSDIIECDLISNRARCSGLENETTSDLICWWPLPLDGISDSPLFVDVCPGHWCPQRRRGPTRPLLFFLTWSYVDVWLNTDMLCRNTSVVLHASRWTVHQQIKPALYWNILPIKCCVLGIGNHQWSFLINCSQGGENPGEKSGFFPGEKSRFFPGEKSGLFPLGNLARSQGDLDI